MGAIARNAIEIFQVDQALEMLRVAQVTIRADNLVPALKQALFLLLSTL